MFLILDPNIFHIDFHYLNFSHPPHKKVLYFIKDPNGVEAVHLIVYFQWTSDKIELNYPRSKFTLTKISISTTNLFPNKRHSVFPNTDLAFLVLIVSITVTLSIPSHNVATNSIPLSSFLALTKPGIPKKFALKMVQVRINLIYVGHMGLHQV